MKFLGNLLTFLDHRGSVIRKCEEELGEYLKSRKVQQPDRKLKSTWKCKEMMRYLPILISIAGIYTAPQSRRYPPSPAKLPPPSQPKNFGMFQRCRKWQKSWKIGEKWVKNQFSIEIFACKFEIFSKMSNINWFFAQTRKHSSLDFLISFKIIKAFQNSIKIALIFIKISFF